MKIVELMGENAVSAKKALQLIEHGAHMSMDNVEAMIDTIDSSEEPVELLKGMASVVCLLAAYLTTDANPDVLFSAIRKSVDDSAERGADVEMNYTVLNLLDATAEDGASFYLQAYALKEPVSVILSLMTLFHTVVRTHLGADMKEVTDHLTHFIEEHL